MKMIALPAVLALACCSPAPPEQVAQPEALVSVARAELARAAESVQLYGTAEAGSGGSAVLSAPEEAIVAGIAVPVGSAVGQGQLIARLSPTPASRLDLARAQSDARAAQLAYARAARLRSDGLVSDAEVETAHALAQTAGATLASFSIRNRALTLRSPVNGHVEMIAAGPGSVVAAGAPVATIARSGDLRARFGIDPALARRIPARALVRISPSAGGAPFTVPLDAVDPFVDPQTRLASLFARLPAAARIGIGEPLSGEVVATQAAVVPSIPYAALLDEGGQPFVFVIARGIAHRREIAVGPANGTRVAVLRGLKPGEIVAVQGLTALEDGMKVRMR
ncbi:MAG: efflux transporter periplasmic adaptor subunit [Alphaproteobacteria bacterium]|nr:efflux transporter periplasmic adaptor subunit [Alphaproteobacteria bacterium]